jgi:hypothetical protein
LSAFLSDGVGVTLIRFSEQNPYVGAGPVVGKILIVCPVSLVNVRISNIFDHHRPLMFSVVRTGRTSSGNGVLGMLILDGGRPNAYI